MKITDFKKGDLIVRVKESKEYSAAPLFVGDPFIFSEIRYGKIYLIRFNCHNEYKPELFEEDLDKRKDDVWEYYEAPEILHTAIMRRLYESIEEAYSKKDIFKEAIFKIAMDQLSKK
jgi:hypothetical protein